MAVAHIIQVRRVRTLVKEAGDAVLATHDEPIMHQQVKVKGLTGSPCFHRIPYTSRFGVVRIYQAGDGLVNRLVMREAFASTYVLVDEEFLKAQAVHVIVAIIRGLEDLKDKATSRKYATQ